MAIYETQKKYFEAAYQKGEHGWPVTGTSPAIVRFLDHFQSEKKSGRILDIGCGEGRNTAVFSQAGYFFIGLDYQSLALSRGSKFHEGPRENFQLVQGDVFYLPI